MVREKSNDSKTFIEEDDSVFGQLEPEVTFPVQAHEIDYEKLISRRPIVMEKVEAMPSYLLKPEILKLLNKEKNQTYRLIYDLMWSTGARISEVLALTPASFDKERHGLNVNLHTLRSHPGRPKKNQLRISERSVQICDLALIDRIKCYKNSGHFKQKDRFFTMSRQTVNHHLLKLIEYEMGAPFIVTSKIFRHSFAIHMLLHGRQIDDISRILGLRTNQSAENYRQVFSGYTSNIMVGVDFH